MANVAVNSNGRYTIDPLYQWDINQVLAIYGLSLASIPEIHFTNSAMDRAIVRQATMDDAGVITVDIPNSLLQKPYKITAYICIYEGETFRSLYSIEIPVTTRNKPGDYTIEDSNGEIYSFKALENLIANTTKNLRADHELLNEELIADHNRMGEELKNQIEEELSEADKWTDNCKQAYFDCYDAISNLGITSEDFNGGDPSTDDTQVDEDDVNGGIPG